MVEKKKKKNKVGRPTKITDVDMEQVERLAGLGLTKEEIAISLNVCHKTISNWFKNENFLRAIKSGRIKADKAVTKSLYKRACGYTEKDDLTGESKYYPPDTTAMIFWLKNRRPATWRDKQDHEHNVSFNFADFVKKASEDKS